VHVVKRPGQGGVGHALVQRRGGELLLALLYLHPEAEYSLTDLLADVEGIAEAYIYGSWAARYRGEPGPPPADVDVLVIGTADPDSLDEAAEQAQRTLHRPVNIRRVRPESWSVTSPADPFLQSVKTRPLVSIGRNPA